MAVTDDIRVKLASSEAADSLRMESFVASCFSKRKWPAEQGVYYTDTDTGKDREIDVLSRHVLQLPKQRGSTGVPLINLSVIAECKSLSDQSLIFLKGNVDDKLGENRLVDRWLTERDIVEVLEAFAQESYYPKLNKRQLYSYFIDRVYPKGGAISQHLRLQPPSVTLIANTFRETKGGQNRDHDSRGTASPIWSAIRSVLSAIKAAEARYTHAMRSYISGRNPYAYDPTDLVKYDAFFFDAEVLRVGCFHPIIFCKSRLFCLEGGEVREVDSARLFIRNLDFSSRYVDIVSFNSAESYIAGMISHFEKSSQNAIRKTRERLEALDWSAGQEFAELATAVGLTSKPLRAKMADRGVKRAAERIREP